MRFQLRGHRSGRNVNMRVARKRGERIAMRQRSELKCVLCDRFANIEQCDRYRREAFEINGSCPAVDASSCISVYSSINSN